MASLLLQAILIASFSYTATTQSIQVHLGPTRIPYRNVSYSASSSQGNFSNGGIGDINIGYDPDKNLIWLVGGYIAYYSLMAFDVTKWNKSTAFIDYGTPLAEATAAAAQSYVQYDGKLYTNRFLRNGLLSFDLSTGNTYNPLVFSDDFNPSSSACIASIDDYIIFTRHGLYRDNAYILKISNLEWNTDGPVIIESRRLHSCVIEPKSGYLYLIGGNDEDTLIDPLDSIEKLYVNDMENINDYEFMMLNDTLTRPKDGTRSILVGTDIYVIGGTTYSGSPTYGIDYDDIDVIDTVTDEVTLRGQLYEPIFGVAPILVGRRVYIFGGFANGGGVNYWQYFDVDEINSFDPTANPTIVPTANPTIDPTVDVPPKSSNSPTIKLEIVMLLLIIVLANFM